ncbi:MAG: hypothetical protein KAT13_06210 [Methanosarcinales archaeon]|nr:hypothetical protein [Methanosarcinales archaeon]MCK4652659.1 hypothetical protein [Methanosarcinales archaeon]MCK4811087.1 hypothetical protein [Methanosarcinales archaeon]
MNLLRILIVPITQSKPIKVTIPCGASAGTGAGVCGASATTTKPGDPLSSPSVAAS